MDKRQGYFIGLAVVVLLAVALTAWQGIAQTTKITPGAGQVGRFQIVVAPEAQELADNFPHKATRVFLLDTQTGRVWHWVNIGKSGETTYLVIMGWQETAVGDISSDRIDMISETNVKN